MSFLSAFIIDDNVLKSVESRYADIASIVDFVAKVENDFHYVLLDNVILTPLISDLRQILNKMCQFRNQFTTHLMMVRCFLHDDGIKYLTKNLCFRK